jgi:hypothetical protein
LFSLEQALEVIQKHGGSNLRQISLKQGADLTLEVVAHFVLEYGLCRETKMAHQQPSVS